MLQKKLKKGVLLESSQHTFIEEIDLKELYSTYKKHKRLSVFNENGLICVDCGVVGKRLILGEDRGGGVHIDLYTDDLILMTVDHIFPKSLGGEEDISNKQAMCTECNHKKGNLVQHNQRIILFPTTDMDKETKALYYQRWCRRYNLIFKKIKNRKIKFKPANSKSYMKAISIHTKGLTLPLKKH